MDLSLTTNNSTIIWILIYMKIRRRDRDRVKMPLRIAIDII